MWIHCGEEVGKHLMENRHRLVDCAKKLTAGSIFMPPSVEVTGTNVAHREIALRPARHLDAVEVLPQEDAPKDARDSQWLVDQRLGVTPIIIEAFQFSFVKGDERSSLIGKELHFLANGKTLQPQAIGAESVHRFVVKVDAVDAAAHYRQSLPYRSTTPRTSNWRHVDP